MHSNNVYATAYRAGGRRRQCRTLLATAAGVLASLAGAAQSFTVSTLAPARNARAAAVGTDVAITFSQAVSAATASGVQVFSAQGGGRRTGGYATSGRTLTFNPAADFRAGETVMASIPATVQSNGGTAASPQVYQFTTAATGTGRGNFLPVGPAVGLPGRPTSATTADLDGDGDLDLLATDQDGLAVSIRLNNGAGVLAAPASNASVAVGDNPDQVVTGDWDSDGDLDFATSNFYSHTISVRLNNGAGVFSAPASNAEVAVGQRPAGLVAGDWDGDGDLDLATSNQDGRSVSIRLNDGTGNFTAPVVGPQVAVNGIAFGLTAGDVDSDGDLDLLTTTYFGVSVRLNNGAGQFSAPTSGAEVAVEGSVTCIALGDVDADGDLDMITGGNSRGTSYTVSLRLNNGAGVFAPPASDADLVVNSYPISVKLNDIDSDGDLDLLVGRYFSNEVGVRLNNGAGNFATVGAEPVGGMFPNRALATGDMDADGDVDLVFVDGSSTPLNVLLNQLPPPTLTGISPALELPGMPVVLTGTNFTPGCTVKFGALPATSITFNSPTSLTVLVPPTAVATASSTVVVSTEGGPTPTAPPFEVLGLRIGNSGCLSTVGYPTTGDGAWHYLLAGDRTVVAALRDTDAGLGTVSVDWLQTSSGAVRQDGSGQRYFDRSWHLTASGGTFAGRSVDVRFFGLNTEFARLQAADPAVTAATLHATQYSGPNEDCTLSNNSAAGQRRVLSAPASSPAGTSWFMAQATVADHFSEFYLMGSSRPLPVELTQFTAVAQGSRTVRLAWATASETNSLRFEVERSTDGVAFVAIGQLAAAGRSTSAQHYQLDDAALPAGTRQLYYRLRQLDADGTVTYSVVRAVAVLPALALAPNPATASTTLTGALPGAAVRVHDALGRLVATATADAAGTAALQLPAGLPAGVYLVRSGSITQRLLVE